MMEWSLPTPARNRYHNLVGEFSSRPDSLPFLRGGTWKVFFTKYAEANLLHKKMLHASRKVSQLARSRRRDKGFLQARKEAVTQLLRGQCNDAYWHGVFGGLYSPHLRTAIGRSLAQAEATADRLTHRKQHYADVEKLDFDADGRDEVYLTSDRYAALLDPDDGGTVSVLDFRPPNVMLINSLARRPESYHAKLRNLTVAQEQGVQSIHEQIRTKEEGLERWLNYDRWPKNAFRILLFGRDRSYQDCGSVRLEEDAALAGGRYQVTEASPTRVALASQDGADWHAQKTLSFLSTPAGFDIICDVTLQRRAQGTVSVNAGIEVVINFLAPSAPDRYFESGGQRFPLRWAAAVPGPGLRIMDEWQRAGVTLEAPEARNFWVSPIETVSESEDGFERIYQGSQVVAVWPVELASGAEWKGQLVLKAARLD
jgi:alpha-amylase